MFLSTFHITNFILGGLSAWNLKKYLHDQFYSDNKYYSEESGDECSNNWLHKVQEIFENKIGNTSFLKKYFDLESSTQ